MAMTTEAELCKAVLKQFADMVSEQVINSMPPDTKFQPKMTLAPFIEAHKAVYGSRVEGDV